MKDKWKWMERKPKFKPGDRVHIVSQSKGAKGAFLGRAGTVQKHPHHDGARHEVEQNGVVYGGTYGVKLDGEDWVGSFLEMTLQAIEQGCKIQSVVIIGGQDAN